MRFKRNWIVLIIGSGAILLAFFFMLHSYLWEKSLIGPFIGQKFIGRVEGLPSSSLQIEKNNVLQVFWDKTTTDPILCFYANASSNAWYQRLVIKEVLPNGQTNIGKFKTLELMDYHRTSDGYKVEIRCNWDWGGNEAGLIYLNRDYSFRSFALSW